MTYLVHVADKLYTPYDIADKLFTHDIADKLFMPWHDIADKLFMP